MLCSPVQCARAACPLPAIWSCFARLPSFGRSSSSAGRLAIAAHDQLQPHSKPILVTILDLGGGSRGLFLRVGLVDADSTLLLEAYRFFMRLSRAARVKLNQSPEACVIAMERSLDHI